MNGLPSIQLQEDQSQVVRKVYADKRYPKFCPVEGCKATRPLLKLSQHLKQLHPNISAEERAALVRKQPRVAKCDASKVRINPPRGQPKILDFMQPPKDQPEFSPSTPVPHRDPKLKGSTRHFPRFDIETNLEMISFQEYLQSIDGKQKSTSVAKAVATEISKYLKYAMPEAATPKWEPITAHRKLMAYLDKMKQEGHCGPEGQLRFLDSVNHALRYAQCMIFGEEDAQLHVRCAQIEQRIKNWKTTLRKGKRLHQEEIMEEFSSKPMSLSEVSMVVESKAMWQRYANITQRMRRGEEVSKEDAKICVMAVASLLLFSGWQRPGAVENCTLEEFGRRRLVQDSSGNKTIVIRVLKHKTALSGPAKLVVDFQHIEKLLTYVSVVRPFLDPEGRSPLLLVRQGGIPLTQTSRHIREMGKKLKFVTPTATRARKVGGTATHKGATGAEHRLITKQLSHSRQVHEQYYEAITSTSDAAKAFQAMERLRKSEDRKGEEPRKKVPYTATENALITEHFRNAILSESTPSLGECDEFLHGSGMDRDKKSVQDKVKNIIKRNKKEKEEREKK